VLWGECISGALYIEDFVRIARQVGFTDPRVLSAAPIDVTDAALKDAVGEAKFYSITYRRAAPA
jgi:arsenite methyltransferase